MTIKMKLVVSVPGEWTVDRRQPIKCLVAAVTLYCRHQLVRGI